MFLNSNNNQNNSNNIIKKCPVPSDFNFQPRNFANFLQANLEAGTGFPRRFDFGFNQNFQEANQRGSRLIRFDKSTA